MSKSAMTSRMVSIPGRGPMMHVMVKIAAAVSPAARQNPVSRLRTVWKSATVRATRTAISYSAIEAKPRRPNMAAIAESNSQL